MPELPQPDAFAWTAEPWGPALRCVSLGRIATHLFSTRALPLAALDEPRGEGWEGLARAMAVEPGAVMRLRQVHGTAVAVVRAHPPGEAVDPPPQADIAITDDPAVALSVRVADCNPILLADRRTGAVAAAHAGWRGTAAGVVAATVRALAHAFGSTPADLVAAVGPSIGPCCYQVGLEVRDAFAQAGADDRDLSRWFRDTPAPPRFPAGTETPDAAWAHGASDFRLPAPDQLTGFGRGAPPDRAHLYADLWAATADQLLRAGLLPAHVHVSGLCTACHRDLFHSYRAERTGGRTAGIIRMRAR